MNERQRLDTFIKLLFFILVCLFFVFVAQISKAQDIPVDVNGVTHRTFNTNADNVYGTLVGVFFFLFIVAFFLIYYVISKFVPVIDGLKTVITNNTQTVNNVAEEMKDLQRHIDNSIREKNEVISMKIENTVSQATNQIITALNSKYNG
jgi:predicted PurR-regulated permease PerM